MLPQVMPGVTVTRAYPASEVAALAEAPTDTEAVPTLEMRGAAALAESGCRVVVRQFPSTSLPAVFVGNGQMVEGTEPTVAVTQVRTNGMDPYLSRIIEWQ